MDAKDGFLLNGEGDVMDDVAAAEVVDAAMEDLDA